MCTKCCAYEGASPFVRKCGSAEGARRGGGKPCEEKVWAREEKHGRVCTHLRVQICAGKCIRAGINCLLMNMCREFDLIFQM